MSGWSDQLRICAHGIQESLDEHNCANCQEIARSRGEDMSEGQTYFYSKEMLGLIRLVEKAQ